MDFETRKKFGELLKSKRKEKNLKQIDCAIGCRVSVVSYQNWERGICEPKEENMDSICNFFVIDKGDWN